MNTFVVVSLQVEGTHRWEECPFKEVSYLRQDHRHMFHIKATMFVSHDDREVEIIKLKHKIQEYLIMGYFDSNKMLCDFDKMSCEMIAKELMEKFDLYSCEVLEDGENGAVVSCKPFPDSWVKKVWDMMGETK